MDGQSWLSPVVGLSITAEELHDVPYPSPEFRSWVWDAFFAGRLDVIIGAAIRSGHAADARSALQYLGTVWHEQVGQDIHVAVADLERRRRNPRFIELVRLVTGAVNRLQDPQLFYGLVSHQALYDLLTGQLDQSQRSTCQAELTFGDGFARPPASYDRHGQFELWPDDRPPSRRFDLRRLTASVERLWLGLCRRRDPARPLTIRPDRRLNLLRTAMAELFGLHAERLRSDRRDPTGRWQMLSLMSLAAVVSFARHQRGPRILFREVPVVNLRHGISGGRIDALEVRTIDGKSPTARQRVRLRQLVNQRYESAGQLLSVLRTVFGKVVEVAVIDWKFLVGDIVRGSDSLVVPDVSAAPMPDHLRQLRRYLTLIPFDYHLHRRQGEMWETTEVVLCGELWYILADQPVRIHQLTMTAEELQQAFTEDVVLNWTGAKQRAMFRRMNNLLFGHLVRLLDGRDSAGAKRPNGRSNGQPALFPELVDSPKTAHRLIEEHRRNHRLYADRFGRIIEIVGHGPYGEQYVLHFDAVLAAIEAGDINQPRHFNPERGGKISCLFPGHEDSTPSLHIRLDRQTFFCFGCERGGRVAAESIPGGFGAETIVEWKAAAARSGSPLQVYRPKFTAVASDEHHRVMSTAQDFLAASFTGSTGERYLEGPRGLASELARAHGAGFGTDRLIIGLLDLGLSLDELRFYGFVSFSDRVSARGGIVPLLKRRGMKLEHMVRPTSWSTKRQEVLGLPYSVLQSRVTFPLELEGRINNFYGRAAFPCNREMAHRKLSIEGTKVWQGGYNMSVLEPNRGCREVIVTEGALDALSLMALGHPAVVAMIGVANEAILRALVRFTGGLAIAFDFDDNQTGQTKTVKLAAELREKGFNGQIRNFTADFLAAHPGLTFKDFNQYLVDIRQTVPQTNS